MNTETGDIINTAGLEGSDNPQLLPIASGEMTAKQTRDRKVSLHDNRSTLGKRRVAYNRMTPNQQKAFRRKLRK